MEHPRDFRAAHRVKVIGYRKQAAKKPQPPYLFSSRRVQGCDLDHRPSCLSNDKRLSARRLVHQTGQLRFGFMDVDRNHDPPIELSSVSLVQNGLSGQEPGAPLLLTRAATHLAQRKLSNYVVIQKEEALVIVPSGNVLNTIVRLQKRLNAVRSGLFPEVH